MKPSYLVAALVTAYVGVGIGYLWPAPVVVLPERFKDHEIIIKGSKNYSALVAKYQKRIAKENSDWQWYSKAVETRLRDQDQELQTLRADKAKATHGITGTVLGLLNIGVMFFTNPFGYLMKTLVGVVEAVAVAVIGYFALRFAIRKLRKP